MELMFDDSVFCEEGFDSCEGKILVATPALDKSVFERTLIYICAHDPSGAVGIIFNNTIDSITSEQVMNIYGIKSKSSRISKDFPIFYGGPVDEDKSVVLRYSDDKNHISSIDIQTNINTFLRDVVSGKVKNKFIFAKGMCGWAPGQLEEELSQNVWLISDNHDPSFIFSRKVKDKWAKVVNNMGIKDFSSLVHYNGNA